MDQKEEKKRGRGRPPKPDAMSGAARAKRFRDAHRGDLKLVASDDVTKKELDDLMRTRRDREIALDAAQAECSRLAEQVSTLERRLVSSDERCDLIILATAVKDKEIFKLKRELAKAKRPPKVVNVSDVAFPEVK